MRIPFKTFAGLLALSATCPAWSQTVTTTPVGAVTLTIKAAPSASTPRYTYLNLPLRNDALYTGKISAVASNTITIDQTVTDTFSGSNPFVLRVTSGAIKGTSFYVTSNSGSVLTLSNQGIDLQALGIVAGSDGDTCMLIPADTLSSIFTDVTHGSTTASSADQIWIWQATSGQFARYYYNTDNSRWQDTVFGLNSNNVVIRPDSGVVYLRRQTSDLNFTITGIVPDTQTRVQIRESGFTLISGSYPVNTTLSSLGLQNNSGWVTSLTASSADQVWIWNPSTGQYARFFHNGTNWKDTVFGLNSDSTSVPAGGLIMVKRYATSGTTFPLFATNIPYSL